MHLGVKVTLHFRSLVECVTVPTVSECEILIKKSQTTNHIYSGVLTLVRHIYSLIAQVEMSFSFSRSSELKHLLFLCTAGLGCGNINASALCEWDTDDTVLEQLYRIYHLKCQLQHTYVTST
jgi:hypothetical protein